MPLLQELVLDALLPPIICYEVQKRIWVKAMMERTGRWPSRMPFSRMMWRMPMRMASPSPPPRGRQASAIRASTLLNGSALPLACFLTLLACLLSNPVIRKMLSHLVCHPLRQRLLYMGYVLALVTARRFPKGSDLLKQAIVYKYQQSSPPTIAVPVELAICAEPKPHKNEGHPLWACRCISLCLPADNNSSAAITDDMYLPHPLHPGHR